MFFVFINKKILSLVIDIHLKKTVYSAELYLSNNNIHNRLSKVVISTN